jgi:PAS domain S-box-containing protein
LNLLKICANINVYSSEEAFLDTLGRGSLTTQTGQNAQNGAATNGTVANGIKPNGVTVNSASVRGVGTNAVSIEGSASLAASVSCLDSNSACGLDSTSALDSATTTVALSIRVLLIDDNKADYLITSDLFADFSDLTFQLEWATNYEHGLNALLKTDYDVCLVDHSLGAHSGIDLMRTAAAAGCNVPMIMLTGVNNREADVEAMRAGAVDYLVKNQLSAPLLERSIRYAMERKRSEEKLQQSQQFLQSTLDALAAHIAVLDGRGTVIAVNEAWRDFADEGGFEGSTYGIGCNYFQICEGASEHSEAGIVAQGIREVLSGERRQFQLEYPCLTPQEQLWFNVRVTRFQGTVPAHVVVAHENITDRKKAEEHRWQSEQRLGSLIKGAPVVVWVVDTNRVFTFSDGRVLSDLGLEPGQVVGKSLQEIYKDYPQVIAAHERAFAGEEVSLETKVSDIVFEARYSPVRDAQGVVTGVFGVAVDIRQRKAAEEALRQSETRFRTVVQSLGEGLLITDLNDVVLYANPRMSDLSGYPIEELLGRRAYELLLPEEKWPEMLDRNEQRASGEPECYEVRLRRKDGSCFWAEVSRTRRTVDAQVHICGTLGGRADITSAKQTIGCTWKKANTACKRCSTTRRMPSC